MKTIPPIYTRALELAISLLAASEDSANGIKLTERVDERLSIFRQAMLEVDETVKALNKADRK